MEGGIPPIERCPSDEHVVHTADVESPPPPPPNHDEAAALAAGVAEMSVNSSSAAAAPVVHFRREVATAHIPHSPSQPTALQQNVNEDSCRV